MSNEKMSSRIPLKKSVQEFILGAEAKNKMDVVGKTETINYPWENRSVRDDVKKSINLMLPEEYLLKIKYISECTNKSQQKIVRQIVCESIDEIIKNIQK
mgnify:CR=1 FL=1